MKDDNGIREPMVLLDNVELKLESEAGPVNILKGINLEISAGETVSVVGPSGSGKTSMMMLIGGLEKQTGGRVAVGGQDLTTLNEDGLARFRRDNVGIVFQNFHLVPTMNALENVAIPAELARLDNAFDRARDALGAVGLGHRTSHYPGQLSGGEQQRVALARAIVDGPKLLLADEPTGNLDAKTGDAVIELLFSLRADHGATLILITHNPAIAEKCGRVIELIDGLIGSDGNVA
ncbi:MAG: ATP-binding cassette domain-containing protein [Pseudomonadota bacterium]|nr:ATP-binding cassette domain-containing protein [Pseudomonadota bacterium]